MTVNVDLEIQSEPDIVLARQSAHQAAIELGFRVIDQSRIATAVSELARNVTRYATDGRGRMSIRQAAANGHNGLEITVSDDGPGIPDINQVMQDGYTSGRGMGLGLPGTKRLMDEMVMESEVGTGTTVIIRKWLR